MGSPIPLSPLQLGLLAIGSINLLVWAFLLGGCSSQSRVAEHQPQGATRSSGAAGVSRRR